MYVHGIYTHIYIYIMRSIMCVKYFDEIASGVQKPKHYAPRRCTSHFESPPMENFTHIKHHNIER